MPTTWTGHHGARLRQALACLVFSALAALSPHSHANYTHSEPGQRFIDMMQNRHGFDRRSVAEALAAATPDPDVLRLIRPPARTGERSWRSYRTRFVEPVRIKNGLRFWNENARWLKAASHRFGVPEEIIVAIIGVETVYGRNTGSFQALSALATLAFDYPPRSELFTRELEHLFLLARQQGRDTGSYYGSYAGALGMPQFLPSSILNYAVDFDGDGHITFEGHAADAIGSVANYLARHGWRTGEPVATPTAAPDPAHAPALTEAGLLPSLPANALIAAGIPLGHASTEDRFALIDLPSTGAPTEYWLGHHNFYVISRYNRSSFYAMSVHQLAQALRKARQRSTR